MDPQQIQPPLSPQPQLQNNHKFIWVLVSVFVLLLISAVCVWYFQIREQKQMVSEVENEVVDVTAGWKTYRNEEYGFELSFNDDWRGYSVEKKDGAIHFLFPTTYSSQKVRLLTIGTTTKSDWEEYLKCDCPRPDYLAEKNGVVFITTRHQDPPPDLTNQYTEINKVLSTFKFVSASTSSDISSWKTYRNEEYGFEFKYPRGWKVDRSNVRDVSTSVYVYNPIIQDMEYNIELNFKVSSSTDFITNIANVEKGEKIVKENIVFNGINWTILNYYFVKQDSDQPPYYKVFYFIIDDVSYRFLSYTDSEFNFPRIEFDQIISSFKFTK
ncbi:MAG: PsbP-related protein [Parcubacteria group bacterium]